MLTSARHEYQSAHAHAERIVQRLERALRCVEGDAVLASTTRQRLDDARELARNLKWLRERCPLDLFGSTAT